MTIPINPDVLCIGHACYDLVFSVPRHPGENEKIFADGLVACGGGPAANAAVAVSRLGFKAAFCGYLGKDLYGNTHWQEFVDNRVDTHLIVRGPSPTPLSTVLVKPDGKRTLINYKGQTKPLPAEAVNFSSVSPKVILFDGHEPWLSLTMAEYARRTGIATVLDAGSLHEGTRALLDKVDYLVCSEKFACQVAGSPEAALSQLAEVSPTVIITLGEKGLIWRKNGKSGALPAFNVTAIDTTGAGDAFHGAFAAAVCSGLDWLDTLLYASAAGSICCTIMGARQGLPSSERHHAFLEQHKEALRN